jgi:hypothetical protein
MYTTGFCELLSAKAFNHGMDEADDINVAWKWRVYGVVDIGARRYGPKGHSQLAESQTSLRQK